MKNLHKHIIFLIAYFISLNTYAIEFKYQNQTSCLIVDVTYLSSHTLNQTFLMSFFLDKIKDRTDKADKKNKIKKKLISLNEIDTQIQVRLSRDNPIEIEEEDLEHLYRNYFIKSDKQIDEFVKIFNKNNITLDDIKFFINDGASVLKLQYKLITKKLNIDSNDITNAFDFSIYKSANFISNNYELLQLSIQKNEKTKTKHIKNILVSLKKKQCAGIMKLILNKKIELKQKILIIIPFIDNKTKLKLHTNSNITINDIGPLYSHDYISFIILVSRENIKNLLTKELKIKHTVLAKSRIKKPSLKNRSKIVYDFNSIKNLPSNEEILKIEWIKTIELPAKLLKRIKFQNDLCYSNILETDIGFHIIQILHRRYNKENGYYNLIVKAITKKKFKHYKKNWLNILKIKSLIKIYDEQ